MLSRDKQSLEFTLTRLFMKIFRTASPAVVIECQRNFRFLPVVLQIQVRTARFLQVFAATENSLCLLFHDNAAKQLYDIFCEYIMFVQRTSLRAESMMHSLQSNTNSNLQLC